MNKLINFFKQGNKASILAALLIIVFIFGSILSMRSCSKEATLVKQDKEFELSKLRDSINTATRKKYIDELEITYAKVEALTRENGELNMLNLKLKKQNENNYRKYDSLVRLMPRRPRY